MELEGVKLRQNTRSRSWGAGSHYVCALALSALAQAGCGATHHNGTQTEDPPDQSMGGSGADPGPGPGGMGPASTISGGMNLTGAPKYYRFLRLTNAQWARSVQEVLRLEQPSELVEYFPSEITGVSDFSNNEQSLNVDTRRWESFQAAAEELAARATATDETLAAVYPGTDVTGFIETVGRRAYSRPLTAEEASELKKLFDAGASTSGAGSSFAKGAAMVIRGLLQSPYFLYRSELGETGAPLSGYEAAAKLSLWLRGATPSDTLLDIAPTLTTAEAVEAEASRLLEASTAHVVMREFHDEYLKLSSFSQLSKTGVPEYDPAINAELEESSALFFDQLFQKGAGLREMLTSTRGFMGPLMAASYGLDAPARGFIEAELGERRAGYFSQLPYLMYHGVNDNPDPIRRGITLALDVLCATLGSANGAIPPLPERQPWMTNRQRVTAMTEGCGATCHTEIIDPLGFAFEHFDGMGQYRELEEQPEGNLPIDSSGTFSFIDGQRDFADNVELMTAMLESQQTHLCYAKKVAGYALQRDIIEADLPWLIQLASVSAADDGSLKHIMLELARSDTFRTHVGGKP